MVSLPMPTSLGMSRVRVNTFRLLLYMLKAQPWVPLRISPVIVNVIDSKLLEQTQSCNISEGLRFQPGLRVETDCQTCNYTQLCMNGLGGADYQINFNQDNSSFIAYLAGQQTTRKHYTGIVPDDPDDIFAHMLDPPYGYTYNTTLQAGTQFNHRLTDFLGGQNVVTLGAEYVYDNVLDTIPAYNYEIDQLTGTFGAFLQSDWDVRRSLTFLAGLRADKHNLVDRVIFSPRVSLLYKLKTYTQFRLTWGTGFRAPQAFDADMHIAFAGGGVSRIVLDPNLVEERSHSLSGSVNYDKATEKFIAGFTLEGFYTRLNDAFFLQPVGADEFGNVFEKRNGSGATVQGGTLELRGNYNKKMQLETGITLQTSLFDVPVENIEGEEPTREFLRTPNQYGYITYTLTPGSKFNAAVTGVYTGPMEMVHFAGAPEQSVNEYVTSSTFFELNLKVGYTFRFEMIDSGLEVFGGVKNITNAYQDDFDTGKNRDSGYVYGPASPRTYYLGLRLRSF